MVQEPLKCLLSYRDEKTLIPNDRRPSIYRGEVFARIHPTAKRHSSCQQDEQKSKAVLSWLERLLDSTDWNGVKVNKN